MAKQGTKTQIYQFEWHGITIEARYEPIKWQVIAHLEIESVEPKRAPLPITQTGYKSYWPEIGAVEEQGGDVIAIITSWLEEEAKSKAWQEYFESQRQYFFF